MAYPQQARFMPAANYYEAPQSAPLESPQEYRQDDYGQSRQERNYSYDDDPRNYHGRPMQVSRSQEQYQQAYPPQKSSVDRRPANQQGRGYRNERWADQNPAPYSHNGSSQGFAHGPAPVRNDRGRASFEGRRDPYYDPQPAYGSQQGRPFPTQYQSDSARSRPTPQRAFSDGGTGQHNPAAENVNLNQDQHGRRTSNGSRARAPILTEAPPRKPGRSRGVFHL